MKHYYFDLHVFFSTDNGFSVGVEIETEIETDLSDDDVKKFAVDNELIDSDDAHYVNNVTKIDYHEFLNLTK